MTWYRRETFLFFSSLKFLQLKMFSRPRCYVSSYCVIAPIRPFPFQKKGNCASLGDYASLHSLPIRSGEALLPLLWSYSTSLWAIYRHANLTCLIKNELTSLFQHWWKKKKSSPLFCSVPSSFQSRLPMYHFPFA